ncbi:T-cell immunoreceptor with Ig and ITIM domains-like [Hypanus sabinus]|uniref:T-cell immunoreceptor with Ig and ITIM domains-like n=1 Tax=Hypanus sabinus TaxID=79690 RepID=UPI0028C469B1|nr:T-cell immunoreceptor with Ig and ITIM domains-like [Hypanus sabinus]
MLMAGNEWNLTVTQSPSHLNAVEGDTVTLMCHIVSSGLDTRIEWHKTWQKAKTSLLTSKWNMTKYYSLAERMEHTFNETSSLLTIFNVTLNDTGRYICEASIEIPPPVFKKSGNGSYLQVQDTSEDSESNAGVAMWILSGLLSIIGLLMSVCSLFLIKRLMCRKKEDPTYINVQFRNKARKNSWLTGQQNTRYVASGRCGYPKTTTSKSLHRLERDLK